MTDGITLVMGDDGAFREMPEPYMTIAVDTEEDWNELQDTVNRSSQMRWISVKDRLPEEGGYHICVAYDGHSERVTFCKYQKRAKCWDLTGCRAHWRITHWMPLPEPPKEGDNA